MTATLLDTPTRTPTEGLRTPQLAAAVPELATVPSAERPAFAPRLLGNKVLSQEIIDLSLVTGEIAAPEEVNRHEFGTLQIYGPTELHGYVPRNLQPREVHLFNLLLLRRGEDMPWEEWEAADHAMLLQRYETNPRGLQRLVPAGNIATAFRRKLGMSCFAHSKTGIQLYAEVPLIDHRPEVIPAPLPTIGRESTRLAINLPTTHQEVNTPPQMEEPPKFVEFASLREREEVFSDIARAYAGHPEVQKRIGALRLESRRNRSLHDSTFAHYRHEITSYHKVTEGEERTQLFQHIERGLAVYQELQGAPPAKDQEAKLIEMVVAYQTLYIGHASFVRYLLERYAPGRSHDVQLIQNTNIELGRAIQRFDSTHANNFYSYLTHWVRLAIHNDAKSNRQYPLTEGELVSKRKIDAARTAYFEKHGTYPNAEMLAKLSGVTQKTVIKITEQLRAETTTNSIEALEARQNENATPVKRPGIHAVLAPPPRDAKDIPRQTENQNFLRGLVDAVALSPKQAALLSIHYGAYLPQAEEYVFPNGEPYQALFNAVVYDGKLTFDEMAKVTGIKRGTIGSCLTTVMKRLRTGAGLSQ